MTAPDRCRPSSENTCNAGAVHTCQLGNRSSVLANFVSRKIGYSKVYNVTNGIERWIKDGNAVVPAVK